MKKDSWHLRQVNSKISRLVAVNGIQAELELWSYM